MKHKISLCMIVKNEERCIERCLDSVEGIVDEIIIVDTGSTDRTLEILEERGISPKFFAWNNDFSAARNYSISSATGDYILQLDADEYLDASTKNVLLQKLDCDYYRMKIRNDLGSGFVEVHYFDRLFRNNIGLSYSGALHEQLSIDDQVMKQGQLDTIIHHDGYKIDVVKDKGKEQRNMNIVKEEVKSNPTAFNYYNLGVQYYQIKDYSAAIDAFKQSYILENNRLFSTKLLVYLGQCLMLSNREEEALAVYRDSIALYPDLTDLYYYKAFVYEKIGYYYDAEECYLKCIDLGDAKKYSNYQEGVGTYLAHIQLASLYAGRGERERALSHAIDSIRASKDNYPSLKVFLSIFPESDRNQLYKILRDNWKLDNSEDVKLLVIALYQLRNPVLINYINEYQIQCNDDMKRSYFILQREYHKAAEVTLNKSEYTTHVISDLFLLSFICNDIKYLDQVKDYLNVTSKEYKLLQKIINRSEIEARELSGVLRIYISTLIQDLLMLKEYEAIEYFSSNLMKNVSVRLILSEKLSDYGFHDIALDVLIDSEARKEKAEVYKRAAKELNNLMDLESSLNYYQEAYQVAHDKESLYGMYMLNVRLDRGDIAKEIFNSMYPKPESQNI